MRRVITVNLGGNAFQLDEDAYERLRAYLAVCAGQLSANPDRTEIVADLERAIAQHLVDNRTAASAIVVSDGEMEHALSTVGTVEHMEPAMAASSPTSPLQSAAWEHTSESSYTRLPIFILCLLFGWLGIHRFFVGKIGTGILMLLTIGGLGIWLMIDLILILLGEFKDRDGHKVVRWT